MIREFLLASTYDVGDWSSAAFMLVAPSLEQNGLWIAFDSLRRIESGSLSKYADVSG